MFQSTDSEREIIPCDAEIGRQTRNVVADLSHLGDEVVGEYVRWIVGEEMARHGRAYPKSGVERLIGYCLAHDYIGTDIVLNLLKVDRSPLTKDSSKRFAAFSNNSPVMTEIGNEVLVAEEQYAPLNSAHEAYGVLTEEYRELEEHIFMKESKRDVPAMRKEAVQLAAMAIRFIRDICDGRNGKSANDATMKAGT
jgi:hypothetical protein